MSDLLRKPNGNTGKIHDLSVEAIKSPLTDQWAYVGFSLYRLTAGEQVSEATADREVILVLVEGKAVIEADGTHFGELGARMNVFERIPPHCLYVSGKTSWIATASTDCTLAVCSAPARGDYATTLIDPNAIELMTRGKDTNTRYIHNIAMEEKDIAGSLLVTEVYTPSGHWSSYPPHRHDVDAPPDITYLEEVYYHRLNPEQGYAHQRVFTESGDLDVTLSPSNHDVVLVPKGHHPCAAPYGYELYYLNVMAGPLRQWRFKNHPDHDWIAKRDI